MVLVAARFHSTIKAEVTERAISDAWYSVIKILKRFQSFSKYAKKCVAAVSVLFDQVPQQLDHEQHQSLQLVQQNRQKPKHPRLQSQAVEDQRRELDAEYQQQHHELLRPPLSTDLTHESGSPSRSALPAINDVLQPAMHHREGGGADDFVFSHSYPVMNPLDESATDLASTTGFFDTSHLQMDLEDMSWLSSLPSQLYGV